MPDWPHAPLHRFDREGFYFVTASTYRRMHHFRSRARLDWFVAHLLQMSRGYGCELQAWAVMSNHYHFVLQTCGDLHAMLTELHRSSAVACNEWDATPGRQVWFQFRDTQLTFERSWMARLHYTNQNPVRHGLVRDAAAYRWCSAAWFERTSHPAFAASVRRFKIDRLNIPDDFDVEPPV